MVRQVGWTGLVERLKNESPRYAQLLPELPRLVHQALLRGRQPDAATLALLAEQRRTNRLLQALLYAAVGFVGGMLVTQIMLRWPGH